MANATPSGEPTAAGPLNPSRAWLGTWLGTFLHGAKIAACGSAFVAFGIGWVLLSLVVAPLAWAWPGTVFQRRLRLQRIIQRVWILFHDYMRWVGLLDYEPRSVPKLCEHLRRFGIVGPVVVVANHPSLVDVTALIAALGTGCFIVKSALISNPVLGPLLRLSGQISSGVAAAPGQAGVVEQGIARVRDGHHLLVFPEGTRSPPGASHRFRLGAFEVARRAGVPVIPVRIDVTPPSLYKGIPWYRITSDRIQLRIELLAPVLPPALVELGGVRASRQLMKRTRAMIFNGSPT